MKKQSLSYLLLLLSLFLVQQALAYDFKVDGLYYNITGAGEVEVTCDYESGIGYSRRIHVPAEVTVHGEKYKVTAIGDGAFMNCSRLVAVNIEEGVRRIGDCAFGWCENLSSVGLPKGLTTIGRQAFQECTDLSSLVIPQSVVRIGAYAFCESAALSSVTLQGGTPPLLGEFAFYGLNAAAQIKVPATAFEHYKAAEEWGKLPQLVPQQ